MFNVCHFEIPADDVERARKFYGELLGWKIEPLPGAKPVEYWLIDNLSPSGAMGPMGGGLMKREMAGQYITIYIEVPAVGDYTEKVKKLGGRVVVPQTAIPEFGYYAVCQDPENNGFGLWEFNSEAK